MDGALGSISSFCDAEEVKIMSSNEHIFTKVFDYVFVTHLPSFYKINLYNQLAKTHRVFVIFIGQASVSRTNDFTEQEKNFDFVILNTGAFEGRSVFKSLSMLWQLLAKLHYQRIIVGGWDLPEYWLIALLKTKRKNYLALESSIFESHTIGSKALIKKFFLKRMNGVFYSGIPHRQLLESLNYQGEMIQTGGVGLMHMAQTFTDKSVENEHLERNRFLYVGRFASEKNIELLLQVFKKFPHYQLTLVGDGPLREKINQAKTDNIRVLGHVHYQALAEVYRQHDIFILPSLKEPWGLVVEEALFYGLPVIASQHVGASMDMIEAYRVGRLFNPVSALDFENAIKWTIENYTALRENISKIDFHARATQQVESYTKTLAV